jgi:hypothetical protein
LLAKMPLVYAIGLDSLMARAVHADLPGAVILRRRALSAHGPQVRGSRQPDLILLDLTQADPEALLAAARLAWGANVPIVGLHRDEPQAYIWKDQGVATLVEIGPGFLCPFLPWAGRNSLDGNPPEAQVVER